MVGVGEVEGISSNRVGVVTSSPNSLESSLPPERANDSCHDWSSIPAVTGAPPDCDLERRHGSRFLKGDVSRSALVIGFISAFALAFGLVTLISSVIGTEPTIDRSLNDEVAKDQLFRNAFTVGGPGVAIHVPHSPDLNPKADSDYLFFTWFKLRKPVAPDERIIFVGKYDPTSRSRAGFSLGLVGGADGVRPTVYWQNETANNRWLTFADTQIRAREWYLLVLTYRKNRFLGLHIVPQSNPRGLKALGGYDFEGDEIFSTDAELVLGSYANGRLRGRLGPFGVLQTSNLTDHLESLIKGMASAPQSIPAVVAPADIVLWSDGQHDIGPRKLQLTGNAISNVPAR